jgi:hypothetical protein
MLRVTCDVLRYTASTHSAQWHTRKHTSYLILVLGSDESQSPSSAGDAIHRFAECGRDTAFKPGVHPDIAPGLTDVLHVFHHVRSPTRSI